MRSINRESGGPESLGDHLTAVDAAPTENRAGAQERVGLHRFEGQERRQVGDARQ